MSERTGSNRLSYGFIAKATLLVIALWALAQAFWLVRDILFIAFAAALLAVFFSLLVDPLSRWIPRWAAGLVALGLFLAAIGGFWMLAWPRLESQVTTVAQDVPRMLGDVVDRLRHWWDRLLPVEGGAARTGSSVQERLGTEALNMVAGALPLLNTAMGAVTGVLVTVFAGVYLAIDPDTYLEGALRLVPERGRARLRDALVETGTTLRHWIVATSISMVVIFTATSIALALLGVPAALVLGLIAGLLVFIPFIGPTLSAVPAIAMALTISPTMALWVAVLYFGIQMLESNFLTPLVMREAVHLEPAATILFQLMMGVLFGFLGLFFAVPLFAALRVLVKRLYTDRIETQPEATPA